MFARNRWVHCYILVAILWFLMFLILLISSLNGQHPSADDLDQRSRSQVKVKCPKICQNLQNGSYLGYYFTYRRHTCYQPNKAHSMNQLPMTLTLVRSRSQVKANGQGQISPKNGKKLKNWSYLGCYVTYRLHTWYQDTTQ